jgi:hypothetical protein
MEIWSKAAAWVDADLSASTLPSRAASMLVAVVPFGLGLLGFGLAEPWRDIILVIGIALAAAWLLFWCWRAVRYLRSVEYFKRLKAERESWPAQVRQVVYGQNKKNYNENKVIAIRNCAIISLLGWCAVGLYFIARENGVSIPSRVSAMIYGLGAFGLIGFTFCAWQLMTSPKQDARLISWLTPGLQDSDPGDTGVQLPDPSDPNFDVATARYLARKIRTR